ncbi:MAG: hypothetical protein LBI05_06445 [Planctomycetaceae bacterium]|jgi:hypothetical protein|nr:hypothetical protein [Planctomycetaceae bacterium]
MATDVSEMTLASMDDVLGATNEQGHFRFPILHLAKNQVPEDEKGWEELAYLANQQGWENVLVFCEGDVHYPDGHGKLTFIELNASNNYTASHDAGAYAEEAWSVYGVNASLISVFPTAGIGNSNMVITALIPAYSGASILGLPPGNYITVFAVVNSENKTIDTVIVSINVLPKLLVVRYGSDLSAQNGETLTINLPPPYTLEKLTIVGEGQWSITERTDTTRLTISPTSGTIPSAGQVTLSTFTKPTAFTPNINGTESTALTVKNGDQGVRVVVNFTEQVSGRFVDGDVGAPEGTAPVYIYI